MGDDCNVASRRSEDLPSSSSPALGARIKDLEECHVGEIALEERDFLLLSRQSGEPEEELYKITDNNKRVVESDLSQPDELAITEPLLFAPSTNVKSTASVFPYFETKLRPDAPPFMPESLTRCSTAPKGTIEINEETITSLDKNYLPRSMIDDSSFVNVELRSSVDDVTPTSSPEMKKQWKMEKRAREFAETIDEPEIRMINVTSTPRVKRSLSKIESAIDSHPANVKIDESIVVVAKSDPNEPDIRETQEEIVESRIVRGHWHVLRTACILSNNIQIIVFIASLVICMILVIYVVI